MKHLTLAFLASLFFLAPLSAMADSPCPTPDQLKTQNGFNDSGVYASGKGVFKLLGTYLNKDGSSLMLALPTVDTLSKNGILGATARTTLDAINNAIHQTSGDVKYINFDGSVCHYVLHTNDLGYKSTSIDMIAFSADKENSQNAPGQL
jgi:hypothetical protein